MGVSRCCSEKEAVGGTGFVGEARSLDGGSLYLGLSIRQTSRGAVRQ